MSATVGYSAASTRKGVYAILIALAAGNMTGRLLAVNSVSRIELEQHQVSQRLAAKERQLRAAGEDDAAVARDLAEARPQIEAKERRQRPFLSANDRSRWLSIRALVERGTFAIDDLLDQNLWNTIDMVRHTGRDGQPHLYSSKPPLLAALLAGEYWLVRAATGWTLADNPYDVGRLMLLTVNVLPLMLLFALVARWAERFGATDWGRIYVVAAASLGTFLTTFAVTLNNHVIAAVCAAIALDAFLRIWFDGDSRVRWYALAGGAAALAAADELPALSLLALLGVALLTRNRRAWLLGFLPAAGLVVAAFFAANYAAHGSLRPPYMHRSETDPADNWYAYTYSVAGVEHKSYWLDPQGVDQGEPSRLVYTANVLVGHHGVFSLTPVWLLTVWGLWLWLRRGSPRLRELAAGIAMLSIVCIVFYTLVVRQQDRNYSGMSSGFRWLFWLAPLWLIAMLPASDRLASSRRGMTIGVTLLAFSVLSVSYPTWNPWIHPWIYQWLAS